MRGPAGFLQLQTRRRGSWQKKERENQPEGRGARGLFQQQRVTPLGWMERGYKQGSFRRELGSRFGVTLQRTLNNKPRRPYMALRGDPREQGGGPPCWKEQSSPATEGRTQGRGRIKSLGSDFTRVPGTAMPRTWGPVGTSGPGRGDAEEE